MKFIHTSDWQVGKVFRTVDEKTMAVLQDERIEVISRIGKLAKDKDVATVLVAGDVYDVEQPSDQTLARPVERMKAFPMVEWHLLPGNHDSYQPNGLWDRLYRKGLPANIHLHVVPGPVPIAGGAAALLPAPLTRRHSLSDPTEYMEGAETAPETIRLGMAHGSVVGFGSELGSTHNLLDLARVERAGLSYLALGDWHGTMQISERVWYSGTPEPDAFKEDAEGSALLVELESPRAVPKVTSLSTGRFRWLDLSGAINGTQDIAVLDGRVRGLDADLSRLVVRVRVEGALSLAERTVFDDTIERQLGAALRFLRIDDSRLTLKPTAEDLDNIDRSGFVRTAAERLRARAEDPNDLQRETAAKALNRLYVLHHREAKR